jgi:hypothetical protein
MAAIVVVIPLIGCGILVFAVTAHDRAEKSASAVEKTKPALMASAAQPRSAPATDPLSVENIILTRFGFEPNEIIRNEDEFLLSVENRSEVGDVDLHIDKVAGSRLHQQQVAKERPDWREFFKLEPGDYVLTEASHPDWICKIKITPR